MDAVDIAIVGTGPAGVSAAITATIRNKSVLLLGSPQLSESIQRAARIDNYPGLPAISGPDFAAALKAHLDALGITITDKRVGGIYAFGDSFSLQVGEDFVDAGAVIVATGISQGKLLEGEDTFLGRGVSYCATCDGRLYKGKRVAVVARSADACEEAAYLAELASEVLYFPQGNAPTPDAANVQVIREKPLAVRASGGTKADTLVTDAAGYPVACTFVLRDAVPPASLVPGVETDGPHIVVNMQMETNIPGLFACGDIAGKPYQYVKSAGQGNVAALSAVQYLARKKAGAKA